MPQSIFAANATQFIDGIDPAFAPSGVWNLGAVYLGGSKSAVRRSLGRFDVFGAAISGRGLAAGDTLTAAELLLETTSVAGPSAWPARIERITRADWDYPTANWTRYKAGSNWTVAGGDVASPPAALAFTSPAGGGAFIIAGLLAFVTDAIASRAGVVLLRLKADDEEPSQSQWCAFDASLVSGLRPRLRVTYAATEPTSIHRSHKTTLSDSRPEEPSHGEQASAPDQPSRPKVRAPASSHLERLTTDDRRPTTDD